MVKIEYEMILQNDIDEIFSYIANPENNPVWDLIPSEANMSSDGSIEVGTTGNSVITFLGNIYEMNFSYDIFDPPNCVSHLSTAGLIVAEMTNDLASVGNGTKLTVQMKIRLRGLRKLVEPFIAKKIRKQIFANLEVLQLFFRLRNVSFA
jgi:hypothetical protein